MCVERRKSRKYSTTFGFLFFFVLGTCSTRENSRFRQHEIFMNEMSWGLCFCVSHIEKQYIWQQWASHGKVSRSKLWVILLCNQYLYIFPFFRHGSSDEIRAFLCLCMCAQLYVLSAHSENMHFYLHFDIALWNVASELTRHMTLWVCLVWKIEK